jgi:methanogenic corrinoid protein MtbC1
MTELETLVREDAVATVSLSGSDPKPHGSAREHYTACLGAVMACDATALELALSDAAVSLSPLVLVEGVLQPLMTEIGKRWHDGELRIYQEHMSSAVVRSFLASLQSRLVNGNSPVQIVVSTPAGHFHELGALVVAVTAAMEDWRVTYLGPNLPAEEIAAAAKEKQARAVALSIVYPSDDPRVVTELRKLGRFLHDDVTLLVGGNAAAAYESVLAEIGAIMLSDLSTLRSELERIRFGS